MRLLQALKSRLPSREQIARNRWLARLDELVRDAGLLVVR